MRKAALIALALTNGIYVVVAILAAKAIWNINQTTNAAIGALHFSTFVEVIGGCMTILLMLSCIIAGWTLFRRERFGLALTVTCTPLIVYIILILLPVVMGSKA